MPVAIDLLHVSLHSPPLAPYVSRGTNINLCQETLETKLNDKKTKRCFCDFSFMSESKLSNTVDVWDLPVLSGLMMSVAFIPIAHLVHVESTLPGTNRLKD